MIKDEIVGKRFKNNAGQEYEVLYMSGKKPKNHVKLFRVRFVATGYERDIEKVEIKRGKIKDRYERSVFGIGYIGNIKMVDYKQEYSVWNSMIERCYYPKSQSYPRYGGRGVTVDERWHSFENFVYDLPLIDGYDKVKFKNKELNLDKDKKQQKCVNKKYSLKTCTFLSQTENNQLIDRSKREKSFYAVSPTGEAIHTQGIRKFSREHNKLDRKIIQKCLRNEIDEYKGWKFKRYIYELV